MKIVINNCFGGFGLSASGVKRYAELIGKKAYFFDNDFGKKYKPITLEEADNKILGYSSFTVPNPEKYLKCGDWFTMSDKERVDYNKRYEEISLYSSDIKRDDPKLIQVVEELGEKANGPCAELSIVEIPDGVKWEIDEYDGNETIHEVHRSWR